MQSLTMPQPIDADDQATGWITRAGASHVQDPPVGGPSGPQADWPEADSRVQLRAEWLRARRRLERARVDADPARLGAALDAIDALLGEMDAVDALQALAHHATMPPAAALDRLEPWAWLQAAWKDVEPLARARQVHAHLKVHGDPESLGAVYGHGPWLHRMLRECFESAVHGAPARARLAIDYRQSGPRALIELSHSQAFASPHDRLRLSLCQRIAAWHGGELRLECDDGQRDWLIDLPTGAPFHAEAASIELDQARRFAQDLSALQARARRRLDAHPADASELPAGDLS